MKLKIYTQKSFERDIKKVKKRGKDLDKLKVVLDLLISKKSLPQKYRDHRLKGEYSKCWECHIEPDWLLIYKKSSSSLILVRTGSHSDLF